MGSGPSAMVLDSARTSGFSHWVGSAAPPGPSNTKPVSVGRQRKGLADYPCKSAGMVEYPFFARAIDPRIRTECVGCPPDPHPQGWFCAWKFTLEEEG